MKTFRIIALLAASVVVVACGGGGGFEPPPSPPVVSNEVPPSATASIAGYVAYLDTLRASDTAEPLDVQAATPPTSDTMEPLAPT